MDDADAEAVRVWWLYGPPCAGKSAAAWRLHTHHLREEPHGYVDVDQLGICYPEPHDEEARSAMKARAVAVVVAQHARAGARTVVVSGVLGPGAHAQVVEALPGVEVRFCRLRAADAVLRTRLQARYSPDDAERALTEAHRLDEDDDGHPVVDSTSSVDGTAAAVFALLSAGAPDHEEGAAVRCGQAAVAPAPRAVLVCGTTGVGTSTAAFGLTMTAWATGRTCAFVDLQQVTFVAGVAPRTAADEAAAAAATVAGLWRVFAAAGAADLVLAGHATTAAEVDALRGALGAGALLTVRLRAGQEQLRRRIAERATGTGGPNLAGDVLRGLDDAAVDAATQEALHRQAVLDAAEVADVVVLTDDLDAASVVARLQALRRVTREAQHAE